MTSKHILQYVPIMMCLTWNPLYLVHPVSCLQAARILEYLANGSCGILTESRYARLYYLLSALITKSSKPLFAAVFAPFILKLCPQCWDLCRAATLKGSLSVDISLYLVR